MAEINYYKLDSTQKTIIICASLLVTLILGIIVLVQKFDMDRHRAGLQECAYVIPGQAGIQLLWQRDCNQTIFNSTTGVQQ